MKKSQKQAVIDYISDHDPEGLIVAEITPNPNLSGGKIKYNPSGVKLHRDISQLTDEEYVRAYVLVKLCAELHHSPGPDLVELEKPYSIGRPNKKAARSDILLRYPAEEDGATPARIFLFIECKAPDKFDSDLALIRGQLFNLARQEEPSPRFGLYYSIQFDDQQILDRALILDFDSYSTWKQWDEAGQPADDVLPERYGQPKRIRFANVESADESLRPLRTDVSRAQFDRLREELHNVVWGGGGTNNNDVFVILVRLFLCRIYDELEAHPDAPYEFQRTSYKDGLNRPGFCGGSNS